MPWKGDGSFGFLLLEILDFPPLSPLSLSRWNCPPGFSQQLHLVWDLISHWLPGDTELKGQEEAQGPSQREERVVPGLQELAVWSRPAEEIYLAGSDAAGCIMTQEDCAIGKQTTMAWLSFSPPFSSLSPLAGGAGAVRGGGGHWPGRGLIWRGHRQGTQQNCVALFSWPHVFVFFLSFLLLPFFIHPPQHSRVGQPREHPLPPLPPPPFPFLLLPINLICPQCSAKWIEFIHTVIQPTSFTHLFGQQIFFEGLR